MKTGVKIVIPGLLGGGNKRVLPKNLQPVPLTLVEDFEVIGDWTAGGVGTSVAEDITNFKTGSKAVQLTAGLGISGTMTKTVNLDLSTAEQIRFRFYLTDTVVSGTGALRLGNTSNFSNAYRFSFTSGALVAGWNHLVLKKTDFASVGSPSWSTAFIRLQFYLTSGAVNNAVGTFDDFETGPKSMGAICVTCDDGHTSLSGLFDHMLARNKRASLFMITSYIDAENYLTTSYLQNLNRRGFDICNHTRNHAYFITDSLTQAQQEAELSGGKDDLDAKGFTRASDHVAYPGGEYNADTLLAMAATGMKTGRGVSQLYHEALPLKDNYYWQTKAYMHSTTTVAAAKAWIDDAKDRGMICVLVFHRLVAGAPAADNEYNLADALEIIDYGIASGMPFVTVSELYRLQSG